jgi:hypothetical protein
MSPNLRFKLSWALTKFACCCVYIGVCVCVCSSELGGGGLEGVGVKLVSFGAHKS